MGTMGAAGWVVALAGALTLTLTCTHHEPGPAARCAAPVADVAAALQPCPTGFVTKSVNEVLAQSFPRGSCFGVRGRLTATYGDPPLLRPLGSGGPHAPADGARTARSRWPLRGLGWALTDLADPFTPRRNDRSRDAQPTIDLFAAGTYRMWLLPLQRCNRDPYGKPIMHPATRFELPSYGMADVERLNAGLAGLTVGVFGGHTAGAVEPETFTSFNPMVITHVCRLDAPPDAAQDGD